MIRMKSSCTALPLLLLGCSPTVDPVGTYQTTPESMVRSIESNLPSEQNAIVKMMRERLESMAKGAPNWRVTLELKADKSFALAMVLPLVPGTTRMSGAWERSGTSLQLAVTHLNGEKLGEPRSANGTIEPNAIKLQPEPGAPYFVLEKQPG